MIDWVFDLNHTAMLGFFFVSYLVTKGLDRLQMTIDSFHEDFRKIHHLDTREYMEMEAQMPGPSRTHKETGSTETFESVFTTFQKKSE